MKLFSRYMVINHYAHIILFNKRFVISREIISGRCNLKKKIEEEGKSWYGSRRSLPPQFLTTDWLFF